MRNNFLKTLCRLFHEENTNDQTNASKVSYQMPNIDSCQYLHLFHLQRIGLAGYSIRKQRSAFKGEVDCLLKSNSKELKKDWVAGWPETPPSINCPGLGLGLSNLPGGNFPELNYLKNFIKTCSGMVNNTRWEKSHFLIFRLQALITGRDLSSKYFHTTWQCLKVEVHLEPSRTSMMECFCENS